MAASISPPLQPSLVQTPPAQSTSCCSEREGSLPFSRAARPQRAPVVEKAQQLPHWPWFLTGVTTFLVVQSIQVGGLVTGWTLPVQERVAVGDFFLRPVYRALNSTRSRSANWLRARSYVSRPRAWRLLCSAMNLQFSLNCLRRKTASEGEYCFPCSFTHEWKELRISTFSRAFLELSWLFRSRTAAAVKRPTNKICFICRNQYYTPNQHPFIGPRSPPFSQSHPHNLPQQYPHTVLNFKMTVYHNHLKQKIFPNAHQLLFPSAASPNQRSSSQAYQGEHKIYSIGGFPREGMVREARKRIKGVNNRFNGVDERQREHNKARRTFNYNFLIEDCKDFLTQPTNHATHPQNPPSTSPAKLKRLTPVDFNLPTPPSMTTLIVQTLEVNRTFLLPKSLPKSLINPCNRWSVEGKPIRPLFNKRMFLTWTQEEREKKGKGKGRREYRVEGWERDEQVEEDNVTEIL